MLGKTQRERIETEVARIGGKNVGVSNVFWSGTNTETYVRFLPPYDSSLPVHWLEMWRHRNLRNEEGRYEEVSCLRNFGKECPICVGIKPFWRSKDAHDVSLAREIKAQKRYLYNMAVFERVAGDGLKPLRVWILNAPGMFHDNFMIPFDNLYQGITDIDTGRYLILKRDINDKNSNVYLYGLMLLPGFESPSLLDKGLLKLIGQSVIDDMTTDAARNGLGIYNLRKSLIELPTSVLQTRLDMKLAENHSEETAPEVAGDTFAFGGNVKATDPVMPVHTAASVPSIKAEGGMPSGIKETKSIDDLKKLLNLS